MKIYDIPDFHLLRHNVFPSNKLPRKIKVPLVSLFSDKDTMSNKTKNEQIV